MIGGEPLSVLAQSGDYHLNLTTKLAEGFRSCLRDFLSETDCQMVALIERSGAVIVSEQKEDAAGLPRGDSLGVLVAGLFAATQMMADMLGNGEDAPEVFCHGTNQHVFLAPVSAEFALIAVFREGVAVGVVRMHAKEAAEKMLGDLRQVVKSRTAYSNSESESSGGGIGDGPFSRYK